MKKTLCALSALLLAAGAVQADVTSLSFADLSTALTGNTLTVGGATDGLVVSGAATDNNYTYSVTYTGQDYDQDGTADTLTFDVLVEAWSGGDINLGLTNEDQATQGTGGSATIGTTDAAVYLGDLGFSVADANMNDNESLEFTVQNFGLTLTDGTKTGSVDSTGFTGVFLNEVSNWGHQTVIGEGTGLLESYWNDPTETLAFDATGTDPLYISSSEDLTSSRGWKWQVQDVDFGIDVTVIPEPATIGMLGLGAAGLLLLRRRYS